MAVAIVTPSGATCRPCGTCRQGLSEIAPDADIVLEDGLAAGYSLERVQDLLPSIRAGEPDRGDTGQGLNPNTPDLKVGPTSCQPNRSAFVMGALPLN